MIEIIPAMDLIDGKCVRLTQGDFSRQTVYADEPLAVAKSFEQAGLKRMHLVDLDGARTGTPANLATLEKIAAGTSLSIDFGGGVKTDDDVAAVFAAGAGIVNIGSMAFREQATFLSIVAKYGGDKILLGADTRGGNVSIDGWQTDTSVPILAFLLKFSGLGVTNVFVTDIASDGAMSGPSLKLYRSIKAAISEIKLVASGGVQSLSDIDELQEIGCSGVILGKSLYENQIDLKELAKYAG